MIVRWVPPLAVVVVLVLCQSRAAMQDNQPASLSLVFLIDVSASVDFRTLELPRDVSSIVDAALLGHLRADDRFSVAAFGATAKFSGFLRGDRANRLAAVKASLRDRSVGLNGPSRVWDAVDEAVRILDGQPRPRAIILMTDGRTNGNRVGLDAVIERAATSAVRISVIASGSADSPETRARYPELEPHGHLQRLVTETGGVFARDEVGDTFRQRRPGRHLEAILRDLGR